MTRFRIERRAQGWQVLKDSSAGRQDGSNFVNWHYLPESDGWTQALVDVVWDLLLNDKPSL